MIHLVKLCVGAESVDDLRHWQNHLYTQQRKLGVDPRPFHQTRQTPKRMDELVDGGSIYWVIKGNILVRQAIVEVQTHQDKFGRNCCDLIFDPELVMTEPQGRKAFQGWRYLTPEDAPADLRTSVAADVPQELGRALKEAGVW